MYRSYLLPALLLVLLLSSPAFADTTTANDPFHDISKFAQRPPEPPVCCLKSLASSDPAEEILSFEDWKAKQAQQQAEGAKLKDAAAKAKYPAPVAQHAEALLEMASDAHSRPPEPPAAPPPPHFRVPLTDRFDYANLDCSGRVHYAHRSAKSPSAILSSKKDRYMLSPCVTPGEDKFVVVELCEDIRIDTVQLANFEFFSGVFKDFSVSVARTYTTDPDGWTPAGTYRAKNIRGIQSFHPPTSLRDFYRFIRIDFHSNFGNEYYCPVSLLRVYGLTHLEQWKWEVWEAESQAKKDEAEEAIVRSISSGYVPVAQEPVQIAEKEMPDGGPGTSNNQLGNATGLSDPPSETVDTTASPTTPTQLTTSEAVFTNIEWHSLTTPSGVANDRPKSTHDSEPFSEDMGSVSDTISISLSATDSSTFVSIISSQSLLSESSSSSNLPSHPPSSESPSHSDSASSSSSASSMNANPKSGLSYSQPPSSSSIPTIIPHESRFVPAVTSTGESIYRTIMTRLSLLEGNSTLHLRYVEEQTRSLRDALRRLEEDVGRLEGIGRAQAQYMQKTMYEWERQHRHLEREHDELLTRVNYLMDEVILEKRLGIAQLCLLLTVLVFMALTRGSRGESIIAPMSSERRNSLREWGRRHFSSFSNGEWASKLRNQSPTPTPEEFIKSPVPVKQTEKIKFPTESKEDVDQTPHRNNTILTAPSFSRPRPPASIRMPHSRQFVAHRPGTPTSTSYSLYSHVPRSPGLLGAYTSAMPSGSISGRPRIRRTSSHNSPAAIAYTLSTGATPLSVKKWAKSSHLHEIRKTKPKQSETQERGPASKTPTGQSQGGSENAHSVQDDGKHVFWPNMPPESVQWGHDQERDGERGSGVREPLSVSALQNRARGQASTDLVGLGLGSPWQPSGGTKIIDLDTESESWVDTDTDVEGSEFGDLSP